MSLRIPSSLLISAIPLLLFVNRASAQESFTPPASPRITFNFNPGWKFIKQDLPGAQALDFDDSSWQLVSTPHTYNDIDSFRTIIGHWTYPAGTKEAIYVAANYVDSVELLLNGDSKGKVATPADGYIYPFPDITFEPGTLKAVAYKNGLPVAAHQIKTAGAPTRIKLTPIVSPGGLRADGGDIALIDVEVLDAAGQRCPTDDARIDFTCSGPAVWRGGYNSGKTNSTNNLYLNTECGINPSFADPIVKLRYQY